MIEISVIIPTYKDDENLNKCIQKLNDQIYPIEKFEVIIINNYAESDIDLTHSHNLNLKVLQETKPGSYAARNRGAKDSKGEILAFTDSDCIPDEHWLENAVKLFNDQNVHLIGGQIEVFDELNNGNAAYIYESYYAFDQEKNITKGVSVTANLFIRKFVFNNLNGFDENLLSGGDIELTRQATKNNYNLIYGENVLVSHPARKNIRQLLLKEIRVSKGIFSKTDKVERVKLILKSIGVIPKLIAHAFKKVSNKYHLIIVIYILIIRSVLRTSIFILLQLNLLNRNS